MRESKQFTKDKARAAGRTPLDGNFIVKRRMHLAVVLGITFCVIGGAVVASSLLLDWVVGAPGNVSLWDLAAKGGIYYLAALVPLAGVLVAVLSALVALTQRRLRRLNAPVSVGAMLVALLVVLSLLLVALQIDGDFIGPSGASFGPAMFMSVFGGVLAVSGGIILALDGLEDRARRGRFSASGGSPLLRTALRPAPRARPLEHAPAAKAAKEGPPSPEEDVGFEEDARISTCPDCKSPIQPNWRICPICGEELQ